MKLKNKTLRLRKTPSPMESDPDPVLVISTHRSYRRSVTLPEPVEGHLCPECGESTQKRSKRITKAKDAPLKDLPTETHFTFQRRYCRKCKVWHHPELPLHPGFLITHDLYRWLRDNEDKSEMWIRQRTGMSVTRIRRILKGNEPISGRLEQPKTEQ